MKKKFGVLILISIIVSSVLLINQGINIIAEECNDCPTPTEPGDADYCGMDHPFNLSSNNDEIECGTPVMITVNEGIGSFTGSLEGNGYTLSKISDREFSLSCNSGGSCGEGPNQTKPFVTVTITDNCGGSKDITIKNSETKWVYVGGCSSGVDELYSENRYYMDPISGNYYRLQVGVYIEEGTYYSFDGSECPSLSAENFNYYPCFSNYANVPWNIIDEWFEEVRNAAGVGPYKVCKPGPYTCFIYHSCSSCTGKHSRLGYLGRVYKLTCL